MTGLFCFSLSYSLGIFCIWGWFFYISSCFRPHRVGYSYEHWRFGIEMASLTWVGVGSGSRGGGELLFGSGSLEQIWDITILWFGSLGFRFSFLLFPPLLSLGLCTDSLWVEVSFFALVL